MTVSYLFPPIGGFGNPSHPWTPPDQFGAIDLQAHRGKSLLMQATPKDLVTGLSFKAYGPLGGLERPSWRVRGNKLYIHPAATIARSSRANDTPSNTWVPDVMQPTLNYGRSLFQTADPMSTTKPASGVIDLDDVNGRLEYLLEYSWDAAPIVISRGYRTSLFSTWATVGRFSGANIIGTLDKKTIKLRDIGWKLAIPLHNKYYGGTGGRDGDPGLKGKWKPYTIGRCFNVPPVQVDGAHQIFQWSFQPSGAVDELRHGGSVLTPTGTDYATYELLVAAVVALAIPDAHYATCLAESMAAVSIDITRSIRIDVQGDNTTQFAHTTPLTRGAIVRRIATCYGDSFLDDNLEIDTDTFNSIDSVHTATVGFYWSDIIDKDIAIDEVMAGILGYWHVRPTGLLAVGFAKSPISFNAIMNLEFQSNGMSLIEMTDFLPPRAQTQIGWKRNYGPESRDQLSPGVDETFAAILGEDSRFTTSGDPGVLSIYPTAATVIIQGNFWNESDAAAEAYRQAIVMGVERRRYRFTMEMDPFADILDQVANLNNVNRLALGDSKPLLCVNVDSVGFGVVTTEWWG